MTDAAQIPDYMRELTERRRLMQNWRGRRLLACRAISDLDSIIGSLGVEDGSELPPNGSTPDTPSPAMVAELQNMAANLLRMILIANDGSVSPQKLQRF